jgi:hypothetical protein
VSAAPTYVAGFIPGDPDCLVAHAFACPYCLAGTVEAFVVAAGDDSEAMCSCAACEEHWTLTLDGWQALRLTLAPPPAAGDGWRLGIVVCRP